MNEASKRFHVPVFASLNNVGPSVTFTAVEVVKIM